jgi:hypothetical protein
MPRQLVAPLLAALLALGTLAPVVSAQGEPTDVYPCIDGLSFTAEPGQPIRLGCGWTAQSPGLMKIYLRAHRGTLTVRNQAGSTVFGADSATFATYWGDVERLPEVDDFCANPNWWLVWWRHTLEAGLPVGTYTITFVESLRHPVTDALQTCRIDGEPALPPPSLYRGPFVAVTTLVVAP